MTGGWVCKPQCVGPRGWASTLRGWLVYKIFGDWKRALMATASIVVLTSCSDRELPLQSTTDPSIGAQALQSATVDIFLHGSGGTANPPSLSIDGVTPTSAAAKYKDSPAIKFSGGNPWTEVGTWIAAPTVSNGFLQALGGAQLWLGLKNSDDIGTRFDVRAVLYKNGSVVAEGQVQCIQGVTRNPALAKQVGVPFASFSAPGFDGTADVLSLKVLTRIGTTSSGAFCGGHSNAVGLRVYFDAEGLASGFQAMFTTIDPGWSTMAPMPTARRLLGVGVVNGVIYAVGGDTSQLSGNDEAYDGVEAYDPATNTWATKAPMPTPRSDVGVGVVNGILYAIGGADAGGAVLGTVEAYDPATNTWTTRAPLPTPRAAAGVAVVGNVLYAIGGDSAGSAHSHTVEAYDPASNTWTTRTPMPSTRLYFSVGAVNGKIYVVGGCPSCNAAPELTVNEEYDPATNTWTVKAAMPTGRHSLGIGIVNGLLYAIGGQTNCCSTMATAEQYDPVADAWTPVASMPTARSAFGVGAANGVLYLMGGMAGPGTFLSTNEAYHP